VFNRRGAIAFTLTLFGYEETFDPSWDGPIAVTLKTTAKALSHQMGHLDPAPTAERQPPKPSAARSQKAFSRQEEKASESS
jgi:hypothetical protein